MFRPLPMLTIVTLASTFSAAPAFAQDSSPLEAIYQCSTITVDADRLACFDANVPALKEREEKKEFVAIETDKVKKLKREAFGFSLPSLPSFLSSSDDKGDDDEPEKLIEPIKSISGSRSPHITLTNGQVWEVTSGSLGPRMRGDLTITIKPASLGSFLATVSNGIRKTKNLRVRRIQ